MAKAIIMTTGVDHIFSSGLFDILELAVEGMGAMDGVIGSNVEVIFMVLLLMYPFIHGLSEVLFQSLAPLS